MGRSLSASQARTPIRPFRSCGRASFTSRYQQSLDLARIRHLPNPPIREAVVDVRVEGLAAHHLPILEELMQGLEGYGDVKGLREFEGRLQIGEDGPAQGETIRHETAGFRATSEDHHQVVQVKLSGFTFSRLDLYTSWPEVRDEAHAVWDRYVAATDVDEVVRVALRYVNHIRMVQPVQSIEGFFRMLPPVPRSVSCFL